MSGGTQDSDGLEALPSLNRLNQIGSGGFATIHKNRQNEEECFKKFRRPILSPGDQARLYHLAAVDGWARPSDLETFRTRFSWPLKLYGSTREVTGFTMPLAPEECWFELQIGPNRRKELLQLKYLTNASYWQSAAVRSEPPELSSSKRNELAIDISETIQTLHRNSLVFGDISSNNACVSLTSSPKVFFLDVDSIGAPVEVASSYVATPDWETPPGLSIVERDVSLTALLIWRLLSEENASYPHSQPFQDTPERVIQLLADVYRTGRSDGLVEISQLLRYNRTEQEKLEVINQATTMKFARIVLREVDPAWEGQRVEDLINQAEIQVDLEEKIDKAERHEYPNLLKQVAHSGGSFALDVLPQSSVKLRPNSQGQLRDLILDAEFSLVAEALTSFGLQGNLEMDPWIPRAIQHVLVQVETLVPRVSKGIGKTVISWVWPKASFVNAAYIEVHTGNSEVHTKEVLRSPGLAEGNIELTNREHEEITGEVRLFAVVKSKSGNSFYAPSEKCEKISFSVLPIPRPVSATPTTVHVGEDRGSIRVVDPIQHAIFLAEKRERLRQERKHKMIRTSLISAVVVVLLGAGWYLYDSFATRTEVQRDLVITKDPFSRENSEIYIVNEKGVAQALTSNTQPESAPVWSNDGKQIVFSRYDGSDWEIWIMEADGSNPRQLTDNDWDDREPAWHPDGESIAFSTLHDGEDWEIYRLSVNNSVLPVPIEDQRQLTNNTTDDQSPEYNSSGDIFFTSSDQEGTKGIFFLDAEGADSQYEESFKQPFFVDESFEFRDLSWSPNGKRIVYAKRPLTEIAAMRDWELWIMDSDGENPKVLTWNQLDDLGPVWTDGSQRVAYSRYDGSDWEIWSIEVDGSNETQLTDNSFDDKTVKDD